MYLIDSLWIKAKSAKQDDSVQLGSGLIQLHYVLFRNDYQISFNRRILPSPRCSPWPQVDILVRCFATGVPFRHNPQHNWLRAVDSPHRLCRHALDQRVRHHVNIEARSWAYYNSYAVELARAWWSKAVASNFKSSSTLSATSGGCDRAYRGCEGCRVAELIGLDLRWIPRGRLDWNRDAAFRVSTS